MQTQVIDYFINDDNFSREFFFHVLNGDMKLSYNNSPLDGSNIIDSFGSNLNKNNFYYPFIHTLYDKINKIHTNNFPDSYISRWHLNVHPTGYDGNAHVDYIDEDLPTYLYMISTNWQNDWGGEFIIYKDNFGEAAEVYSFKTDRLIIFNGRKPHRGIGALRLSSLLRTTIAFQCKSKKELK